jgi:hypothetical protein
VKRKKSKHKQPLRKVAASGERDPMAIFAVRGIPNRRGVRSGVDITVEAGDRTRTSWSSSGNPQSISEVFIVSLRVVGRKRRAC